MADVVSNDVLSNGKRNHHGGDKEEESQGQTKEQRGNYGNGKPTPGNSHSNSTASNHSNQEEVGVPEDEAGDNTEAEGWGSSREGTPSISATVLRCGPGIAPSPSPGLSIPPGLAPLTFPEHSAYTPSAAPNTPIPFSNHDDTDSPSLAAGGVPSNQDPPIIIGPEDPDGVRYRRSAPAPIYPLALEIPRISEPDPMDMYDNHRISPSTDLESGLRSSLQSHGHSRAGSDLSSAVSTPHSPVRFKEPITDDSPCPDPSPDGRTGQGADPGTAPGEEDLLFPGFVPVVFRCLTQTTQPRFYCLKTITWPYPFETTKNNHSSFAANNNTAQRHNDHVSNLCTSS